ncbi:MAG: GntR family transcriptional regulator [Spirochaetota bacterium]
MAEKSLSESIHTQLSERILRWDYLPGHRFTEEGLCGEFHVSRSPVREALHKLAEGGLIEQRPRQGYLVRLLDFKEIDELYDVRLALEEFVVSRICRQGMDEVRLSELIMFWTDLYGRLPETADLVPRADEEFHETLAGFTHNSRLSQALKDIDRRIHFIRLFDFTDTERVGSTCTEHMDLLRALRDRDLARALEALRRNIEGGRSSVERAIKEALAHAYRNRD